MTNDAYIASGILELYVAGALTDAENEAVYQKLLEEPELLEEVLRIESAVVQLTAAVAPQDSKYLWPALKARLGLDKSGQTPVKLLNPTRTRWFAYTGWAATILLVGGLMWLLNQYHGLEADIETVEIELNKRNIENVLLEDQIEKATANLKETQQLLQVLRDRNITRVPLEGQTVYPEGYAQVYWDQDNQTIYLDAQALPKPPEGKVYQVWSLTLNPLTPTSLGTLDSFNSDANKIFALNNVHASEAFGVTLEPAGGSESPTLEQLYTLGVVAAAP